MADEENREQTQEQTQEPELNEDGTPKIPDNFVPKIEDDEPKKDEGENSEETKEEEEPLISKKMLIVIIALGALATILTAVLIYMILTKKEPVVEEEPPPPPPKADIAHFDNKKIDNLIKKANILYEKGDKKEALELYNVLANYSTSLSRYNYGVIKMNAGEYKDAINNFKEVLKSKQNRTVAAINLAVCYLKLGDNERFNYYIDLANIYLPYEARSPLYNYYLALIKYYKGLYPQALQMLVNSENIVNYGDDASYLAAKVFAKMDADKSAIKLLKEQGSYEASLSLGLLSARLGKYKQALKYLQRAAMIDGLSDRSNIASALIEMKLGNYESAKALLSAVKDKANIFKYYPIKIGLRKELYDIQAAQDHFKKDFLSTDKEIFDFLFYFAAYRVYDYERAIKNFNLKQIEMSAFLKDAKGTKISNPKTQDRVSDAVLKALDYKLLSANKIFYELVQENGENGIFHYNLALTYAQLQDYKRALKHFSTAYHLNPRDYLAGAFALMCYKLLGLDAVKLENEILEAMSFEKDEKKQKFYKYFFYLTKGDFISMIPLLDQKISNDPLHLMLAIVVANTNKMYKKANDQIMRLKSILKKDILTNILFFNNNNKNKNMKDYALAAQLYFTSNKLDYRPLYSSAKVVKDNYIALMQIAGLLNIQRDILKKHLTLSDEDTIGVMSALAFIDIFAKQYEESYALYNVLMDTYKLSDSNTIFLASVAAIGADNPNSAIALLELSKFGNTENKDARLALGLLYHEVKNLEPALFQYNKVGNNHHSRYFTFTLEPGQ